MRTGGRVVVGLALAFAVSGGMAEAKPAKRPDLAVLSVERPPDRLAPGTSFLAATSVQNKGSRAGKASTIGFFLSRDAKRSKDDASAGTVTLLSLKRRASRLVTARAKVPAGTAPGSYRLVACVDPGGKQAERSEQNNCAAATGALVVEVPTAPPVPAAQAPVGGQNAAETPPARAPGAVADPGAAVPLLLSLSPAGPSPSRTTTVTGRAEAGRAIEVLNDSCAGGLAGQGTAGPDGAFSILVTGLPNADSAFVARALSAGGPSACSGALVFRHDDRLDVPQSPSFTASQGVDPQSAILGRAESGAEVRVFTGADRAVDCTGTAAGQVRSDGTPFTIAVPVAVDAVTHAAVQITDLAGNSACFRDTPSLRHANHQSVPPASFVTFGSLTNGAPIRAQGIAHPGDDVQLFASADCTGAVLRTLAAAAGNGAWSTDIAPPENATTSYSVRARRPSTGLVSLCEGPRTLTHDDLIADPVVTSAPTEGASRSVEVRGTSDPRTAVSGYRTADCAGDVAYSSFAPESGQWIAWVDVEHESTTPLSFRARDQAGNASACVASASYRHRPPVAVPTQLATNPRGPSGDATPVVQGVADPAADVRVYATDDCTGPVLATTTVTRADGLWSVEVTVASNRGTALRARATNPRTGDVSACSEHTFFTHDDQVARPVLTHTTPASPSPETQTVVRYTAGELGTLQWFRSADCSGTGTDRVSGPTNHEGFLLEVAPESSTTVSARFIDRAGNTSACSDPLTYVSATPPGTPTALRLQTDTPSTARGFNLEGRGTPGETVILYADPVGTAPCTTEVRRGVVPADGLWVLNGLAPANARTVTAARAIKPAFGSQSSCVTGPEFRHDDQPPAAPAIAGARPSSGDVRPTFRGTGEPGATVVLRTGDCASLPGSAVVAGDGTWSADTTLPPEAVSEVAARQIDEVGLRSPCSPPVSYSTVTSVLEREVNDTRTDADARAADGIRAANADAIFRGQARAGDTDVFAIDVLGRDRTLHLETFGDDPFRCGDRQTRLRLLAADGSVLVTDTDAGDGLCSRIVRHGLASGRYYAEVRGDADGIVDVPGYHLLVDLGVADEVPELDGGQLRNGTPALADTRADVDGVRLVTEGVASGRLPKFFEDDVDVMRLDVLAPSLYRLQTFRGDGEGCNDLAPGGSLLAAGANVVFATTELGIDGCRGGFGDLAAGASYLRVFSSEPDSGSWRAEVDAIADGGAEAEPNDTAAAAGTLINGQAVRGAIAPGAFDLWRITVPTGGRTVRLDVVGGAPVNGRCAAVGQLDSTLSLLTADGSALAFDDDDGEGLCSRIDGMGSAPLDPAAAGLPAGQYLVRVGTDAAGLAGTFNYRLTVTMR